MKKALTSRQSLYSTVRLLGWYVAGLAFPAILSAQTTHTWTGNLGVNWENASNWDNNAIPANGDSLIFDGSNTETVNGLVNLLLRSVTFASTATGAFEIWGNNTLRIGGTLTNLSDYEVFIENNIQAVTGGPVIPNGWTGGGQSGLIIDVGHAGMTITGNITVDNVERNLVKTGTGTLTLNGNSYQTGQFQINQGTLVVDGGTFSQLMNARFAMGSGWDPDAPETFASTTLIGRNGATGSLGLASRLRGYSGANQIIIESGASLRADNWSNNGANFSTPTVGLATLNIDLTDGGTFTIGTGTGFLNYFTTVSESVTVSEQTVARTGFGWTVAGDVTRATPHLTVFTGGTTSPNIHYSTSGNIELGGVNRLNTSSLTVTGAGSLSMTSNPNGYFSAQAILLEEGVGNYAVNVRWLPGSNGTAFIHQYSTDGVLTFNRHIETTGHVVKTGPGTVVYSSSAGNNTIHTGQTEIQGGRFVLDGGFTATTYLRVRGADSVLSGQGTIGGHLISGVARYTAVQVFDGGTLEGNNHLMKALTIHGSLTFLEDSQYQMQLHAVRQDPLTILGTTGDSPQAALVTLAGNLALTLENVIDWSAVGPIILLRTDGSITGTFSSINGSAFVNGNLFELSDGTSSYWFEIDYNYTGDIGYTGVALLHSIPEPATIPLLLGASAMIFFLHSRRKKNVG